MSRTRKKLSKKSPEDFGRRKSESKAYRNKKRQSIQQAMDQAWKEGLEEYANEN